MPKANRKPEPQVIMLNDDETFAGVAGTHIVDTDGRIYDLESILMETPAKLWTKWRLRRSKTPRLFDRIENSIRDTDKSFTGLEK